MGAIASGLLASYEGYLKTKVLWFLYLVDEIDEPSLILNTAC